MTGKIMKTKIGYSKYFNNEPHYETIMMICVPINGVLEEGKEVGKAPTLVREI